MKIPNKLKRKNHIYKYLSHPNERIFLYEDEKLKYKECFFADDLTAYAMWEYGEVYEPKTL